MSDIRRAGVLGAPFDEAHAVLGLSVGHDPAERKKAYRRAVASHPPDRDPDGFRRVREAYELLSSPLEAATRRLKSPEPLAPPPEIAPEAIAEPGTVSLLVLRWLASQADAAALLGEGRA